MTKSQCSLFKSFPIKTGTGREIKLFTVRIHFDQESIPREIEFKGENRNVEKEEKIERLAVRGEKKMSSYSHTKERNEGKGKGRRLIHT